MQPWALVTPASRGIGLELAGRLLQTSKVPVIATARKDLDQTKENVLSGLKDVKEDRLNVLKVDFLGKSAFFSSYTTLSISQTSNPLPMPRKKPTSSSRRRTHICIYRYAYRGY